MKKSFATIIFLIICAASTICFAAPGGAMRLGILPVFKASTVTANLRSADLEIVTGTIYEGMINCGDFEVLSRTDVDKLIQEHELKSWGIVDESTAPQFGRMLGAEYILIANVTGLNNSKKSDSAKDNNYIVTAKMSVRVVEVESGRVVLAATTSVDSKVKVTGNLVRIGTTNFDPAIANDALEKAAVDVVGKLLANLEQKKKAAQ